VAPCYTPPIFGAFSLSIRSSNQWQSSFAVLARDNQIRLRHVVFGALLVMFLFVLWHDELFIFNHADEKWAHYYPVRWALLPHVLGGLTALLIGPFQFSSRFRQRHLRAHRIMGRVYFSSVAVSAVVALYLTANHQNLLQSRFWLFTLAIVWLITGAMALTAIRNGNIQTHRQWMARNYALTSIFVTVRVMHFIPFPSSYEEAPAWILFLGTLLLTEMGLSWRNVFTNRRSEQFTATK
jgi:uncharacterized membrane protein